MLPKIIYLDHAATTPLAPEVLEAMRPWLTGEYGNPSSLHRLGQHAKSALEQARRDVTELLYCSPEEIIFTSGGTESDNLALKGILRREKSGHLITTAVEHHAILHPAENLKKEGYEVTVLPVDKFGRVKVGQVEKALQPNTKLVSVMLANNEIGTLNPVREIGKMLEKKRERGLADQSSKSKGGEINIPLLHTDAVQGGGSLNLDVRHLKVDLLSLSGHKFYGPKGTGILYIKKGTALTPQQTGGSQEQQLRAGTENVAGIVGLVTALKLAEKKRSKEAQRLAGLRDYFIQRVLKEIPRSRLNGHPSERLAGNAHFSFHGVEGESILLRLDFEGICGSSGSACTSGSLDPSHVLIAIGVSDSWLHGSLRLTLGQTSTKPALNKTIATLKKIIKDLRAISPLA